MSTPSTPLVPLTSWRLRCPERGKAELYLIYEGNKHLLLELTHGQLWAVAPDIIKALRDWPLPVDGPPKPVTG